MKENWKDYKTYSKNGTLRTWIEISDLGNINGHLLNYKEYEESKAITYDKNGRKLLFGVPFYRIVDELFRGKKPKGLDIHHADFDKTNDSLANLIRLTRAEHMKIHGVGENNNMHTHEYTKETRKKMSESAKERIKKYGQMKGNKGMKWYTNGIKRICCMPGKEPKGYWQGMK